MKWRNSDWSSTKKCSMGLPELWIDTWTWTDDCFSWGMKLWVASKCFWPSSSLRIYIYSKSHIKKKKTSRHLFTKIMSKVYMWRKGILQVHMPQGNGFLKVPYTDDYAIFPPLLKIIEVILSAILRHFPIFKQRLIHRIHVLKTYCG